MCKVNNYLRFLTVNVRLCKHSLTQLTLSHLFFKMKLDNANKLTYVLRKKKLVFKGFVCPHVHIHEFGHLNTHTELPLLLPTDHVISILATMGAYLN